MEKIHKYRLLFQTVQKIEMPAGAEVITAGQDTQGRICVWAIANDEVEETEDIKILGFQDGEEFPEKEDEVFEHLGTVRWGTTMNKQLVHVFVAYDASTIQP